MPITTDKILMTTDVTKTGEIKFVSVMNNKLKTLLNVLLYIVNATIKGIK